MSKKRLLLIIGLVVIGGLLYQRLAEQYTHHDVHAMHTQLTNGDEQRYPDKRGSFGKGLKHKKNNLLNVAAFEQLIRTTQTRKLTDFNRIPWGTKPPERIYTSLLSALPEHLIGKEIWLQTMPPAPELASAQKAGEMVELYWHALLRDVAFTEYDTNARVAKAAQDLSTLSDFKGPKQDGKVTPATLFRAPFPGSLIGPQISQFFYTDVPLAGGGSLAQRYQAPTASLQNEFMTTIDEWSFIARGHNPRKKIVFDTTPRYIQTMRDLGNYVHEDPPQWHFLCTQLILLGYGPEALKKGAPELTDSLQPAQNEFCKLHVAALVALATEMSLRAARYQKWFVHRTLRPETCAFLINQQITKVFDADLHSNVINSQAIKDIFALNTKINKGQGTYLLPQMYPEGSPLHPTYPSGHATVAGGCITVLKAFFNADFVIPGPMIPSADGTTLVAYTKEPLNIGNELNKFAANIAIGRDMAGMHYRSDAIESMLLGEKVSLALLTDWAQTHNTSFELTKFDGTIVKIAPR